MRRRLVLAQAVSGVALALFASRASAQYEAPDPQWGPTATYYNTATGTGATLKANLNAIIDQNTISPYDNSGHTADSTVRLQVLDADPAVPGNVKLIYSGFSVAGTWDGGNTWNREHLWCNSYGIDSTGPAYGDLFNLRPCNPDVNSTRNDRYYDNCTGALPNNSPTFVQDNAPECRMDGTSPGAWMPRAADRGDIARSLFYMDTRYEGDATDGEPDNFTLTDNTALINTSSAYMGKLSTLLRWNYQDGITNAERKRNYQVDTLYQHNRNPFVDHPEYVWTVFGSGPNTSQITISGGTAGVSGASSKSVALRVIKGAAWGTANVTLAKTGATPTTYDVLTGGNATSSAAGVGQPFDYDPVNRTIDVGMTGSTAGTGTFSGTITVHNTDLTTGGAGMGSQDGNDAINVTGTVLEHSNASLDAASDVNAKTIDFGYCPAGFATRVLPFGVNNLATGSAAFTANLDVDSVNKSGPTQMFTNATGGASVAAGSSASYTVSFLPGINAGPFSATYTIGNSDEDIPGATAGTNLVLTTTSRTFTAATFPVSGFLNLLSGETLNTGAMQIAGGVTLDKQGPGVMNVDGAQSHGANAALSVSGGVVNMSSDAGSAASKVLAITANAGGVVNFSSPQHLRSLGVAGGNVNVAAGGGNMIVTDGLNHLGTSKLDLADNDMIVHGGDVGTWNAGTSKYSGISGLIASGKTPGATWNGNGVITSMSPATTGRTTLATATAADVFGPGFTSGTWEGETVTADSVLVKYTYAGDADLNGKIDGDDYFYIDSGYADQQHSYHWGDFDYSGTVNSSDYFLIDSNFLMQGSPLVPGSGGSSGAMAAVAAVPEPSAVGVGVVAAMGWMIRGRRRHRVIRQTQ